MGKPAARLGDMHICPKVEPGPVPHVGGPIVNGSRDVFIGSMPAARVGDMLTCVGPPDKITQGSSTVLINGKPAARMGDATAHGGRIVIGCFTVLIGDSGGGGTVAPATGDNSHLPKPPQSKAEVLQRMEQATQTVNERRAAKQPLPQSPYSTADKLRIVEDGLKEKFIVRVIKTDYAGDGGNIGRPGVKPATYWTTTYTQLEHADKDAELICQGVGIDYDPKESYTLLLIDVQEAAVEGDMETFIPTYENLSGFANRELKENFKDNAALVKAAMTPEYSEVYERLKSHANAGKYDLGDRDQFDRFSKKLELDADQRKLLKVRHQLNDKLGANEQFLGNGMTKDNNADNPVTPFGPAKVGYTYGPVETFTYDKNPQTLGKLEKEGILTRIPLTNPAKKG